MLNNAHTGRDHQLDSTRTYHAWFSFCWVLGMCAPTFARPTYLAHSGNLAQQFQHSPRPPPGSSSGISLPPRTSIVSGLSCVVRLLYLSTTVVFWILRCDANWLHAASSALIGCRRIWHVFSPPGVVLCVVAEPGLPGATSGDVPQSARFYFHPETSIHLRERWGRFGDAQWCSSAQLHALVGNHMLPLSISSQRQNARTFTNTGACATMFYL